MSFARALKAAARAVSLYPAAHPAIHSAFARLIEAAETATADGPFTVSVQPDALSVDGRTPSRPDSVAGELAASLHQLLIGQLTVRPGVSLDDWRLFLGLLTTPPDAVRAQGGPAQAWAEAAGQHIEIREIDYREMLREKQAGEAATWDRVIAGALKQDGLALDDATLRELADMAGNPAMLDTFIGRVEAQVSGPGAARARATVLHGVLDRVVAFLKAREPAQVPAVLDHVAHTLGRLPDDAVAALVVTWAESGFDPDRGALLEQMAEQMPSAQTTGVADQTAGVADQTAGVAAPPASVAAQSPVSHRGATPRLAEMFQALAASPLAETPEFQDMWARASELLERQAEGAFVSESYDRELNTVPSQAAEVERIADDPPERVAAWLATVGDAALRALDLQLLLDLIRIETNPERWRETAGMVAARVDDLLLVGDFAAARQLVEALTAQTATAADPHRVQWVIAAIDTLVRGQMLGHLGSHLQTITGDEFDEVKRLCLAVGPSLIMPLADAVASEARARVRHRMTDLLLSFGAEGRGSTERLMRSANPAVRRIAVQMLRQFGGRDALADLTALLADAEAHVRSEAVRAIATIGSDEAYAVLERALTAGDERARDAILHELTTLRAGGAAPLFCHIVCHTEHRGPAEELCLMALARLGSLGGPEALAALKVVLYRGEWWAPGRTARLREAAARALVKMGTAEARRILDEAAASGPRGVRAAARKAAR